MEGLIAYNPDKKIILYTDNAKAHHSKKLEPFLEANKDKLELKFEDPRNISRFELENIENIPYAIDLIRESFEIFRKELIKKFDII